MGTNCAPLLTDILFYSYEAEFIQSLLSTSRKQLASRFNFTYRYIDDVLSINNPELNLRPKKRPRATFLSTFYWLMRGFHLTFATGVACWRGTLTHPDTSSRPILDLHVLLVEPNPILKFVVILSAYAFRISLGTFSILLSIRHCQISMICLKLKRMTINLF